MRNLICLPLIIAALGGCQTVYEDRPVQIAEAELADASGAAIGTARFYALADEVTVNVAMRGLTSGQRAIHLHTTGNCSAADFSSAGSHLNPAGHQHGALNPQGPHLGDLPNVTIAADGTGTVSALLAGGRASVLGHFFDDDGTAIVVHQSPDDYRTDPTGGAGARVACGVLTASNAAP